MPVEKRAIRAIVLFCLGVGFVIGFLWLAYTTKPDQTEWFVPGMVVPEGIVIYYGESCPHCRILEGYIADNDVMSKVHIVQKEVSLNETNAAEMRSWAVKCGIKDYVGCALWGINRASVS